MTTEEETSSKLCMISVGIPDHMHEGLVNYIHHHKRPGDFMVAVLSNDLKEAVARADEHNINALKAWGTFLYMYAPAGCWGSPARAKHWLEHKPKGEQV